MTHAELKMALESRRADLRGADLRGAVLRRLDLAGAVLRGADLAGADLRWADLAGADLRKADLTGADLRWADLTGADLTGAVLAGADLAGAVLREAVGVSPLAAARLEILPRRGEVWGWKACLDGVLVELAVPDGVERSNAAGRKCRARLVRVVAVHGAEIGVSRRDGLTPYHAGDVVECDRWEPDRWVECGGGIHFFLTREEAEASSRLGVGDRPTPGADDG